MKLYSVCQYLNVAEPPLSCLYAWRYLGVCGILTIKLEIRDSHYITILGGHSTTQRIDVVRPLETMNRIFRTISTFKSDCILQ
jgi:hypothetical protein